MAGKAILCLADSDSAPRYLKAYCAACVPTSSLVTIIISSFRSSVRSHLVVSNLLLEH